MQNKKHAHKYQRFEQGQNKWSVYKCMLLGCNSRIIEDDILGRDIVCWKCGNVFKSTIANTVSTYKDGKRVYRVKPTCCSGKGKTLIPTTSEEKQDVLDDILHKVGLK